MCIDAYSLMCKGGYSMENLFKALSEPNRLRILSLLIHGEMCVCEIEYSLKLTQSCASRHLNALKQCGILEKYKQAQWTYYKMSEQFKKNNSDLWRYLSEKLPKLQSYDEDYRSYQICKNKGDCCHINIPH